MKNGWDTFFSTGRVEDYLHYKYEMTEKITQENKDEQTQNKKELDGSFRDNQKMKYCNGAAYLS